MELSEKSVNPNPFIQFEVWYREVLKSDMIEPSAMILTTVSLDRKPSARVVLLKEYNENGFIFFTNYKSKKAVDIEKNSSVALLFFWREFARQIRIEGTAEKIPVELSREYFKTRPRESQVGAWASKQSSIITDRQYLDNQFKIYVDEFAEQQVPLPDYWGGYSMIPDYFEFWQGRENRLHDRICYKKNKNSWDILRLSP